MRVKWVQDESEVWRIITMISQTQLHWPLLQHGHMDDGRLPKQLFNEELSASRRHIGGQRKCYMDVLKSTLKAYGVKLHTHISSSTMKYYYWYYHNIWKLWHWLNLCTCRKEMYKLTERNCMNIQKGIVWTYRKELLTSISSIKTQSSINKSRITIRISLYKIIARITIEAVLKIKVDEFITLYNHSVAI